MDLSEFIAFKHPFTCLVGGPAGCGKTVIIRNILNNYAILIDNIISLKPLWCYGIHQSIYEKNLTNVDIMYREVIPSAAVISNYDPNIIIIDDLMTESKTDKNIVDLFTKGSHHKNISVIYLVQNMFFKSPMMRTISLNSHYLILMKNPRDRSQIRFIAQQLYPTKINRLIEAYNDARKQPYSYIKVDCTAKTPDDFRLQSRLTPEENNGIWSPVIYAPKDVREPNEVHEKDTNNRRN